MGKEKDMGKEDVGQEDVGKTDETLKRFHGLSTASALCHNGGGIVAPPPETTKSTP